MGILIYLIVFTISCSLLILVEKKKLKKSTSVVLKGIALLLPILLAGMRDITVGTDVQVYVIPAYYAARASESVFQYMAVTKIEPGFALLVYGITQIFDSIFVILLAIHVIVVILTYLSICNYQNKISSALGMLVFYLLYFNMSLNIMRQWMAMAILLYASKHMFSHKFIRYLILVGIASCFHETGLVGMLQCAIFAYLDKRSRLVFRWGNVRVKGSKLKIYVVISVMTVCFFSLFGLISKVLAGLGFEKYLQYLRGGIVFSLNQLLLRIPLLVLLFANRKEFLKNRGSRFLICAIVLDLLLSQLAAGGNQSWRIALYFGMYSIFTYPLVCYSGKTNLARTIIVGITIVFLVAYWFYSYVIMGMHSTIPYRIH